MTTVPTPSSTTENPLRAQIFQRLHPKAYLERFLSEELRPDGREKDDWRDVSFNVGSISTANGSSLVRMGSTTVVCGVKAEIAEPELDKPNEGYLVPNLDLPAACSSKFKPGPPSEESQVISERLMEALTSCGVISLPSLCIHSAKAVWVLYVDAVCINYDGNVFDATLLAMIVALRNTSLPTAKYDEELNRTVCSRKTLTKLALISQPMSFTFGLFDSTQVLADPSAFEEPLLDSTITVIVDERGELASVSQTGLSASTTILSKCISSAKSRYTQLQSLVSSV